MSIVICLNLFLNLACQTNSEKYSHTRASAEYISEWNRSSANKIPSAAEIQNNSPSPNPSPKAIQPKNKIVLTERKIHLIFPELEATERKITTHKSRSVVGLAAYFPGIEKISANGQVIHFSNSDNHYSKFLFEPGARTVQFKIPLNVVSKSNLIEVTIIGTDGLRTQRQIRLEDDNPIIISQGSNEEGRKIIEYGRYWALLIANQNYTNGLPSLDTPINDAMALKNILETNYGFDSKRIFLVKDASLTKMREVLDLIHEKVEGNDSLLLYYAGHGHLDEAFGNKGFWIPVDGKAPSANNIGYRTTWLPNSQVHDIIQANRAKHVLLISDSCYSGTFKTRAISEPQRYAASMEFFYKIAANYSRRAITSGNLEPVADGGGNGHSIFAYHLLQVLKNSNRTLNAEHLFQELRDNVSQASKQNPQYFIIDKQKDAGGDFLFISR